MTPEWILLLLADPQGFWQQLSYYLAAPFTGNGTGTAVLSEFLGTLLNRPLWFVVLVLFVLLFGGSLLVGAAVTASETRREKSEQLERYLAKYKRLDENCSPDFIAPLEREELDRR